LSAPQYAAIDTAFSISVAILYAQIVDLKEADKEQTYPVYQQIYEDVVFVLDESHRDGSLKEQVAKDLDRYIIKEAKLVTALERFRKHDKMLFIVTNSDFHYTKLLLDYAINPFLKDFKSWMDLFQIVVTSAQKPRFFYDNLPFLKVNPDNGTMTNFDAKLVPGVYQGGCASLFTKDLNVAGDDILYIGDHIYGDILRLKKHCNWRTALIIEELEDEIKKMKMVAPIQEEISQLMAAKEPLESELVDLLSIKIESGDTTKDKHADTLQSQINELDKKISPLIKKQASIFNSEWGEVMRAGNEESYFAHQVDRFADVYMASLIDIFNSSPRTYFRARRRPLAHELALELVLDEA
jgi:hypothetical protein